MCRNPRGHTGSGALREPPARRARSSLPRPTLTPPSVRTSLRGRLSSRTSDSAGQSRARALHVSRHRHPLPLGGRTVSPAHRPQPPRPERQPCWSPAPATPSRAASRCQSTGPPPPSPAAAPAHGLRIAARPSPTLVVPNCALRSHPGPTQHPAWPQGLRWLTSRTSRPSPGEPSAPPRTPVPQTPLLTPEVR